MNFGEIGLTKTSLVKNILISLGFRYNLKNAIIDFSLPFVVFERTDTSLNLIILYPEYSPNLLLNKLYIDQRTNELYAIKSIEKGQTDLIEADIQDGDSNVKSSIFVKYISAKIEIKEKLPKGLDTILYLKNHPEVLPAEFSMFKTISSSYLDITMKVDSSGCFIYQQKENLNLFYKSFFNKINQFHKKPKSNIDVYKKSA